MEWLPRWLGERYSQLYGRFEERPFDFDDACKVLREKDSFVRAIISSLRKHGYLKDLKRKGRKRQYRLISPSKASLILSVERKVTEKINNPIYARLINRYVRELFDYFGDRLVSIVVYGSVARGDIHATSDIDLLLVIKDLSPTIGRYDELMKLDDEAIRDEAYRLWLEKKIYPHIQLYLLTPEEARYHRPIYLDMTEDAIILYDRDDFMRNVFEGMAERLKELKAKRCWLPNGSWYWILKPEVKRGEVVEI